MCWWADLNTLLLTGQDSWGVDQGDLFQELVGTCCSLKLCQEAIAILGQALQSPQYPPHGMRHMRWPEANFHCLGFHPDEHSRAWPLAIVVCRHPTDLQPGSKPAEVGKSVT